MPKHPKRPRDPAQLAKLVVDIATGDKKPDETRRPAVPGNSKGGLNRARVMSSKERKAIAEKAANARWKKDRPVPEKTE